MRAFTEPQKKKKKKKEKKDKARFIIIIQGIRVPNVNVHR